MSVFFREILALPVEQIRGIGARRGTALREAGIATLGDLLYYLPRRYLDRTRLVPVGRAVPGREVTLVGQVRRIDSVPGARSRFTLALEDDTGGITCVWFHGGRYLRHTFREGDLLAVSGKVELFRGERQMVHPEYEFVRSVGDPDLLHTSGIVPLYGTSSEMKERGLRSRGFRRLIHQAIEEFGGRIQDGLPAEMRARLGLMELREAFRQVHFPDSMEAARQARRRLAFDELFGLQVRLARRRRRRAERSGISFVPSRRLVPALLDSLPFEPTQAQQRVIQEIEADMARPFPMFRLLQGDVGSGKTLVALCALLTAVENQYQAAFMAPTEILAEQHFLRIREWVEPLGVRTALLVGGRPEVQKRDLLRRLREGEIDIAVGTHALIQEGVEFPRLGLSVIDEQHRFGVAQRARLYRKGRGGDMLVMTATPIPRSLALTLYGDLALSVIDELPPGRRPVRTVLRGEDRREAIFGFVLEQIQGGRQAYVVYPAVEESERNDLKSATEGFEELREGWLRGCSMGLVHGRMKGEGKAVVMERFRRGEIQVLVSTTVIEVGVDVPNATVMVVEHAERFGLSQLHQLRGRVGRGSEESYCILIASLEECPEGSDALERLRTICRTQDGFEIAEKDLQLRGPGEFFGLRQAGLPEFRAADLAADGELLLLAREEAVQWVEEEEGLNDWPEER